MTGFEMGPTLAWYERAGVSLPCISKQPLPFPIENTQCIQLDANVLGGLFDLFPASARKRSILRKVVGQPTTWFRHDSLDGQITTTTKVDDALTPTSFVPSYCDYSPWRELKRPTADVWLYKMPQTVPEHQRTIVLAEGFLHEIGHTLAQPALYVDDYALRLGSSGRVVNGLEFVIEFANLAEKHPPISHYASEYRWQNKFEGHPRHDPKT